MGRSGQHGLSILCITCRRSYLNHVFHHIVMQQQLAVDSIITVATGWQQLTYLSGTICEHRTAC
jgi:hypothetical protein